MKTLCAFIAAVLLVAAAPSARAEAEGLTEKQKNILAMIETTGMSQMFDSMVPLIMQEISPLIRKLAPDISDEHFTKVMTIMEQEFMASRDEFLMSLIPLYDSLLTEQEIADSLAFYRTPSGRSMIAKMPQLMQGGMAVGQRWGQSVTGRAIQRLQQELRDLGYKI